MDRAAEEFSVSVVVIKSAGRVFCAGYDLNQADWITSEYPARFLNRVDLGQDKSDIVELLGYWVDMRRFPKPIICEVQGACLSGAGAGELLALSDLVVFSKEAVFGHPAARDLGIPPTVFFLASHDRYAKD